MSGKFHCDFDILSGGGISRNAKLGEQGKLRKRKYDQLLGELILAIGK